MSLPIVAGHAGRSVAPPVSVARGISPPPRYPHGMRIWIDLANSPHVPMFGPIVEVLRDRGDEVLLTARDHAQTRQLAERVFGVVPVIGQESPSGRLQKGIGIARRAEALRVFARANRPAVALSHGSYAQILAARSARIPCVTMMDYEFQPANHLSFRLARYVVVPAAFPASALSRFGARPRKVIRYDGFKEQLYLDGASVTEDVLGALEIDPASIVVVMRPPPDGALYHPGDNARFEAILDRIGEMPDVRVVLLPRTNDQQARYGARDRLIVPPKAVDGTSLLLQADLMIGAGGTMNREAALLGTPTYTMFAGRLAAVDAELIRGGIMHDLRGDGVDPVFAKKATLGAVAAVGGARIVLDRVIEAVDRAAG